jgi:hypothetical protein
MSATTYPGMGHKGVRVVASHCPGCCEALGESYGVVADYLSKDLSRRIRYFLCRPCGQRLERAGKRKRRQLLETIERNLEQMGMLTGLERKGGEA